MGTLTISDLTPMAGEPRVRDVRLGEALGFSAPRLVRRVIKTNMDELLGHGPSCQVSTMVDIGSGARRAVDEYHLNEAQALLVCMFARTDRAAAVRKQVVDVFLAWRRGELTEARTTPDPTVAVLERLERRLSALEATGRHLSAIAVEPDSSARALTYSDVVWPVTARHARPRFWHDIEVRGLLLAHHRQTTIDRCRALCVETYGEDRTPSRSAMGRFWKALDRLRGQYPSLKAH